MIKKLYQVIGVILASKLMMWALPDSKRFIKGIVITAETNCMEVCDILRLKLTGYVDTLNLHIMNDGSGNWIGCMCR